MSTDPAPYTARAITSDEALSIFAERHGGITGRATRWNLPAIYQFRNLPGTYCITTTDPAKWLQADTSGQPASELDPYPDMNTDPARLHHHDAKWLLFRAVSDHRKTKPLSDRAVRKAAAAYLSLIRRATHPGPLRRKLVASAITAWRKPGYKAITP